MALSVDIKDQVSGALRELRGRLSPGQMNPAVGGAVKLLVQSHLVGLGRNKLGWPSTGFYPAAARSTSWQATAAGAVVSVNQVGIRQRYEGGPIHPTGGRKYLTIPARSEAYGRRAREFPDLVPVFRRRGGETRAVALARAVQTQFSLRHGRRKTTRDTATTAGGEIMFWLVRAVHQDPDRGVLPTTEQMRATALQAIREVIARALQKGGNLT